MAEDILKFDVQRLAICRGAPEDGGDGFGCVCTRILPGVDQFQVNHSKIFEVPETRNILWEGVSEEWGDRKVGGDKVCRNREVVGGPEGEE